MPSSPNGFRPALTAASQSITRRGLNLLANQPERFAAFEGQALSAYLPALAVDLRTPELDNLLAQAAQEFGGAVVPIDPAQRELLRNAFLEDLKAAVPLVDWTHPERVARCAAAIAEELELVPAEVHEIYWGGLLHDLGKVLAEPLAVTAQDNGAPPRYGLALIRTHAGLGGLLLDTVQPLFPTACLCASQHQESVDGTGYPFGRRYEKLSLPGMIANLADGYDACVTRLGWTAEQYTADVSAMYARTGHPDAPALRAFTAVAYRHHAKWYLGR
jgi:response regulator RpfG family c-di-GMP phosphodiesterase